MENSIPESTSDTEAWKELNEMCTFLDSFVLVLETQAVSQYPDTFDFEWFIVMYLCIDLFVSIVWCVVDQGLAREWISMLGNAEAKECYSVKLESTNEVGFCTSLHEWCYQHEISRWSNPPSAFQCSWKCSTQRFVSKRSLRRCKKMLHEVTVAWLWNHVLIFVQYNKKTKHSFHLHTFIHSYIS